MVMEVVHEDVGDDTMQCVNHPYKNSTPGGICAFCLQEKLGNLISSSFSVAVCPSSSPSPSPSFRSDVGGSRIKTAATDAGLGGGGSTLQLRTIGSSSSADIKSGNNACSYHGYNTRKSRLPFVLTHRRRKKDGVTGNAESASIVFKRSKSTTTPRRGMNVLNYPEDCSPHRRGFWSFLYLSKKSTIKKSDTKSNKDSNFALATPSTVGFPSAIRSMEKTKEDFVVIDENDSPSYDRKVSRSRSVGCGSRSFSGDFFERISTGFGDCTLRRVESHREGKPKLPPLHRNGSNNINNGQDCIKERVKCGGIFSGFMITSSSSYLVPSSTEESNVNGKTSYSNHPSMEHISHGRSKSWVWALASPMRAFVKPSTGKRGDASTKYTSPNLGAIPSLLAVSG